MTVREQVRVRPEPMPGRAARRSAPSWASGRARWMIAAILRARSLACIEGVFLIPMFKHTDIQPRSAQCRPRNQGASGRTRMASPPCRPAAAGERSSATSRAGCEAVKQLLSPGGCDAGPQAGLGQTRAYVHSRACQRLTGRPPVCQVRRRARAQESARWPGSRTQPAPPPSVAGGRPGDCTLSGRPRRSNRP